MGPESGPGTRRSATACRIVSRLTGVKPAATARNPTTDSRRGSGPVESFHVRTSDTQNPRSICSRYRVGATNTGVARARQEQELVPLARFVRESSQIAHVRTRREDRPRRAGGTQVGLTASRPLLERLLHVYRLIRLRNESASTVAGARDSPSVSVNLPSMTVSSSRSGVADWTFE